MHTPFALLRFVARAALNAVSGGMAGDFVFDVLPQMSKDVWGWWGKERTPEERKAELQALASAPATEVHQQIHLITNEVAADQPPEVKARLETYLTQMPGVIHRSLRRKGDPRGVTLPDSLGLHRAEDLMP